MSRIGQALGFVAVVALAAGTALAAAGDKRFPRIRYGIGAEPTAGGGVVAGTPYATHSAVVAWNRKRANLTLYLIRSRTVSCRTLKQVITRPGHLIQAEIVARPLKTYLGRPLPDQTLQFVTYRRHQPLADAGLSQGVRLVLTRIDSYVGGVWHGSLSVPTKAYANHKVYGYRGTFAARWCELRK